MQQVLVSWPGVGNLVGEILGGRLAGAAANAGQDDPGYTVEALKGA